MGRKDKNRKICLLGASFETGNMGVSALAESSIKLILHRWPDAEITLIGGGCQLQRRRLSIMGKEVQVTLLPIRSSKNVFLRCHLLRFALYGLLAKVLPGSWFKACFVNRNEFFRILYEANIVADITGGDSFSDIYGLKRFFRGFLHKWLVIFLGKELILLPQTYGPFKKPVTRALARYVMTHASLIYSRDRAGVEYVKRLLGVHSENGKIRFAPDVAFVLDAREPETAGLELLEDVRPGEDSTVVGFNISGLLFNGGYTQDNMFGLRTDYQELVYEIAKLLLKHKEVVVLLIPHVFPPKGLEVESDSEACRKIYAKMHIGYPGRIFMLDGTYDQGEIKYLIGKCDFFIGSRMHSCIAALSQCVPAVGLAYSQKFQGVFESIDVENSVIDIRNAEAKEILNTVSMAFEQRKETAERLKTTMPSVGQQLVGIFDDVA
ncbi:MAG: polysaccharide pyruvyl transferase family protein [Phycisphaerales bacterium]|nr:MAG: polysaccharide pyruvyl transferase family protein [Phycisphaerales bacterium]